MYTTLHTHRKVAVLIVSSRDRFEEIQLAIAELEGRRMTVEIIDYLHVVPGISRYDPATDGPVAEQVIMERQRELFLESHPIHDKPPSILPCPSAAEDPCPGVGAKGGFSE